MISLHRRVVIGAQNTANYGLFHSFQPVCSPRIWDMPADFRQARNRRSRARASLPEQFRGAVGSSERDSDMRKKNLRCPTLMGIVAATLVTASASAGTIVLQNSFGDS